jgi:arylsulfatase A-like enzyme
VKSKFSRRQFIRTAAFGSAALAVGSGLRAQPSELSRKPNLVVFLPDDLRADTIVGRNAIGVHAPNLHKLASQSVTFERAYVTQPICSPSRSSLLSGTWPHQNGCLNNDGILPRRFRCLPELLDDPSYVGGYFGKWHLGDEFVPQHGFSEWASIIEFSKPVERVHDAHPWLHKLTSLLDTRAATIEHRVHKASDYTAFLISKGYKPDAYRGRYFSDNFYTRLPFELSKARFVETKACDFLERHGRSPFVMFVAFFEPHPPYYGPFNDEHPIESIQLDPTVGDTLTSDIPLRYRVRQEAYRRRFASLDGYRRVKQHYFGLVTEIDLCIGNILEKIQALGIADRTITVLTSDHSDMMSAHGLLGKGVMYEQAVRVPYLIRVPGIAPRRISPPVSHIDFVPTMLELLGKVASSQCAGKSRARLIRGETEPPDLAFLQWAPARRGRADYLQSHLSSKQEIENCLHESTRAVISPEGWKLCLRDKDKNELYNLGDDPDERHNVYYDNAYREVAALLTNEIHGWQERVGDQLAI